MTASRPAPHSPILASLHPERHPASSIPPKLTRTWQEASASNKENANKTYRQFYRQLALPAVTISNLQRREAPLSTCNHC